MTSKRSRINKANQSSPPPDSLVTEVFECLAQASRKQLLNLLSVLTKASTTSALEQVRAEAVKSGALVDTRSRFQRCNHSLLDSCFGLLDLRSLQAAESVCRRWRYAGVDSGAGWKSVLGFTNVPSVETLVECKRHCFRVSQIRDRRAVSAVSIDCVKIFSQLTSLSQLHVDSHWSDVRPVLSLPGLEELSTKAMSRTLPAEIAQFAPNLKAFSSSAFPVLQDIKQCEEELRLLSSLPSLHTLTLKQESPWVIRWSLAFLDSGFTALTTLTLSTSGHMSCRLNTASFKPLLALPRLRHLNVLGSISREAFVELGQLTKLHHLSLTTWRDLPGDEDDELDNFSTLTNLTSLHLDVRCFHLDYFDDRHLAFLSNLTNLTDLFVAAVIEKPTMLAKLTQMQKLHLKASVFDTDWAALKSHTQLRRLELDLSDYDPEYRDNVLGDARNALPSNVVVVSM